MPNSSHNLLNGTVGRGRQLYDVNANRLYVNAAERERFLAAARLAEPSIRSFCETLTFTGCRISEALALTTASVQIADRRVTFRTLKQRGRLAVREVPVPRRLIEILTSVHRLSDPGPEPTLLWHHDGQPLNRSTAYRAVKRVMLDAGITGAMATPKGLRHGFGVEAVRSGVQLHMLAKWMGHTNLSTTAIYATVAGTEELAIADRMWRTTSDMPPSE